MVASRWWAARLRRREGGWVEGPSLAITVIFVFEITYVSRLSVSIREVASEYPFYIFVYMNSYISQIYFLILFYCQTHLQYVVFWILKRYHWPTHMDLIVFAIRGKSTQIRTHIHTKIHKQKTKQKQKEEKKKRREKRERGKRKKKERGGVALGR